LPTTLGNLGGALNAEGRFEEAEAPIREAIDLGEKIHQPTHHGVLGARNLLCYALEGQRRWAEAEAGYLAVLADRRRIEAEASSNYMTMRTVAFIARLYAKQERWPDAARYLAELILAEKPDPKRTIDGVAAPLAAALAGQSDPESAGPRLRECWEVLKVRMWTGEWLTAEVASRYGDCLRRQGKLSEAGPILTDASNDIQKAVGVPAWGVAAARSRLASYEEARKKPGAASN
jgi:tetratricopeptide (TPR) repeat protein